MNRTKQEELERACRGEKDRKVRNRMLAVRMVRVHSLSVEETADYLMQCPNWVRNWLRKCDEGGPDGLRDLSRSGRPRRIPSDTVDGIVAGVAGSGITPKGLQRIMHEEIGVKLHITYVRKIMHAHGLSPKAPERIHTNRASKRAVQNWQYRLNKRISCLKRDGFVLAAEDESFFIHDMIVGRKYWSPVGSPIRITYTGSHKKITAYGSITTDGRQFFRTYEKFDAPTFVRYLKEMQRHFGKMAVVVDRAPPHKAKAVRKLLRENKNIKIIYLMKGSPFLNVMEECWHRGKRVLLVSEYYKTFLEMHQAVFLYYRTARFKLDLLKFASRKPAIYCKNL